MAMKLFPSVRVFGLLTFLSICGVMAADSVVSARSIAPRCKSVEIIAHRGFWDNDHTENTLKSFRRAHRHGVMSIETDLRLSKDGRWVLMHDQTVNRTTNGAGMVKERTVEQLKSLKTNDGTLGGVPTLEEALRFMKNHSSATMQLELKDYNLNDVQVLGLIALVNSQGVQKRVQYISFDRGVLKQIQRLAPNEKVGLLSMKRVSAKDANEFDETVLVRNTEITDRYVADMHRAGTKVYTWTVDQESTYRQMIFSGADGVTSDRPKALMNYCPS